MYPGLLRWGWAVAVIVLFAVMAADRWRWAALAQWREDQATNLWLGLTRGIGELPVGLISSVGVPNPNGMPLLGKALSWLPGLMEVSWVLGILQGALALLLVVSLSLGRLHQLLIMLVLLSSVVLRAASVELWNQWVLTSLNLAFAASIALFVRRPSPLWLPAWTAMAVVAPSLYLAGLVNGMVYSGIGAILLLAYRPRATAAVWGAATLASALVIGVSTWVTWIPYVAAVPIDVIGSAVPASGIRRLVFTLLSTANSPVWWPSIWLTQLSFPILQSNWAVLPNSARLALSVGVALLVVQYLAFLVSCYASARRWSGVIPRPLFSVVASRSALAQVAWISLAVMVAHLASPLLGGPALALGERKDMSVQWLPLLLVIWFGGAFALGRGQRIDLALRWISTVTAVSFVAASLVLGIIVQEAYLSYRGNVLAPADVPLVHKGDLIKYVASDARARGAEAVEIDYDLGGGTWDWVPEFGAALHRWYPAPMTLGRALDYELLRRHGLRNEREGSPRPPRQGARYMVTYASNPPPVGDEYRHILFGRLRLSIQERKHGG